MSRLFSLLATIAVIVIAVLQFPAVAPHPSRNVVLGLSLAAVLFVIASYILAALENRRRRRKEAERDKEQDGRWDEMMTLQRTAIQTRDAMSKVVEEQQTYALLATSKEKQGLSEKTKQSLPEKIRKAALDLLAYLKEKGPTPEYPSVSGKRSSDEIWEHYRKVKRPFEEKINAGYSADFADRISKLRHEIKKSDGDTSELNQLVDKNYHTSEMVRLLAAMLLEIAIRMETDELLRGGA